MVFLLNVWMIGFEVFEIGFQNDFFKG